MNRRTISQWMALVLLAVPGLLQAQYAEDALRFSQYGLNVGARAQGMGSVGVGLADDISAIFSNPAGLAQIRSYEISLGLNRNSYTNDLRYLGTATTGTNNTIALSNAGFVYPLPTSRGSLTFAFAYGRVESFNSIATINGTNLSNSIVQSLLSSSITDFLYNASLIDTVAGWGDFVSLVRDSVGQTATVLESGGINHWSFGGAMDIAPSLSVGVTLNFMSGSYTYDRQFAETDPFGVHRTYVPRVSTDLQEFDWNSTFKSDLSGFNALIGIMYRKQGKFRVGATVRTPTSIEISETFNDSYRVYGHGTLPYPVDGPYMTSGETKYRVVTPYVLSAGASVQPMEFLLLAGDAEYTDWTQVQFDSNDPYLTQENQLIKTSLFRDTWNLRGGAEISFFELGLKLRGGIVYNPSPYKADQNHSDRDEMYYTGGMGITLEGSTTVNIAYSYGTWKTFRYNYSIPTIPSASRTDESIKNSQLNVTLSYRF